MLRFMNAVDELGSSVKIVPTQIVAFAECDDRIQVFVSGGGSFYVDEVSLRDFEDALRVALRSYYESN